MIRFSFGYFVLTGLLFLTEVFIGLKMHDAFIRPYGGDFLVVILMYCFVKTFADTPVVVTAIGVLLFSYLIEISQYFHLVNLLGLQGSATARMVLGTGFSCIDLLMYTLGIIPIIIIERLIDHDKPTQP